MKNVVKTPLEYRLRFENMIKITLTSIAREPLGLMKEHSKMYGAWVWGPEEAKPPKKMRFRKWTNKKTPVTIITRKTQIKSCKEMYHGTSNWLEVIKQRVFPWCLFSYEYAFFTPGDFFSWLAFSYRDNFLGVNFRGSFPLMQFFFPWLFFSARIMYYVLYYMLGSKSFIIFTWPH